VERLAVPVGEVGQVVHGFGDIVDRHHVGVAEVGADEGQPAGEVVPHHLHQREHVVGPVDLVHDAGLGVPDDDRGPVDAPRHGGSPHDLLRLELRAVVGRGEVLALVEHGLVEDAVVVTGRGHRRHLVEAAHLQRVGQLEGVLGAADVQLLVGGVVRGHVVDRGQVEEVLDSLSVVGTVLVDPGLVHAQPLVGEVADHGHDAVGPPGPDECLQPRQGGLPAQDEDRPLAVVGELGHEVSPDEPRGAGDEVRHGGTLPVSCGG